MEVQEVEITITKTGEVKLHVRGVKGLACLELTQSVEQALGGMVESREMTPDSLDDTGNPIDQSPRLTQKN